ncbi:MAG: hypothetical protein IJZ15_04330 [Oscillospiraceae bacterium]|nr:hypothetical protein [Oscillospiraceae bacterium]
MMSKQWITTEGGIILPPPELGSGKISISTIVDGGRNTQGVFVGAVIGDDKLKIEMNMGDLSPEEFRNLLMIFDRKQGGKFVNTFRVYDPRINGFRNIDMYVGDRSGTPYLVGSNGLPLYIKDVQANLIEV